MAVAYPAPNLVAKPETGPSANAQNASGDSGDASKSGPPSSPTLGDVPSGTPPSPITSFDSANAPEVVPMKQKEISKFYEPLILLKTLNFGMRDTAVPINSEVSIDAENDLEIFKAFVYKLGHICDGVKGGSTTTAFCVLQQDENLVQYRFASNQQSPQQLQVTHAHIKNILDKVKDSFEDQKTETELSDSLLVDILLFNRARVAHYVRQIKELISKCTSSCAKNINTKKICETLNGTLTELFDWTEFDVETCSTDHFISKSIKLVKKLEKIQLSPGGQLVIERSREAQQLLNIPNEECWANLQHATNRMLAYAQSVRFILKAKEKWPRLFQRYEVSYLESSTKLPRPSHNLSNKANEIVNRMTKAEDVRESFQEFVRKFQACDIDASIQKQYQQRDFQPYVHAEVLLLDHLYKQGLLEPRFFFNNYMYIGTSKPTCKLCNYYFKAFTPKVYCRRTHGNIYSSWRFPDLLRSQGPAGQRKKQAIFDRVLNKVKEDAVGLIQQKMPSTYRKEDSFTFSAILTSLHDSGREGEGEEDDVASTMGQPDDN